MSDAENNRISPSRTDLSYAPPGPSRGLRLLRLRLSGVSRNYEIDLRGPDGAHRPLSVIAGPTNTGKTSVLRFLAYCLGGSDFPDNPEVVRQVRSAVTEATDPEGRVSLERVIGAKNILVARPTPGREEGSAALHPVEPAGDPSSVSQLLLATVGLQGVQLREAPTQRASSTDPLSFRDVMWLCLFLNERIGSTQLLHETDNMKKLKLRQVVDAIFGVHDDDGTELARRLREASAALDNARRDVERLADFVREQQPVPLELLQQEVEQADRQIRDADATMALLDTRQAAAADFAADLRARHAAAAARAVEARALVRDRRSLVNRFASLRAQYADDVRKLTLLNESASVFDQLSVKVCPACLSELPQPPSVVNGHCSLCAHPLPALTELGLAASIAGEPHLADDTDDAVADRSAIVRAELRATKRRYAELTDYWQDLDAGLSALEAAADKADADEAEAAAAVDRASAGQLTPYASEREETLRRRQAAVVLRDRAAAGVRLWEGVQERERAAALLAAQVERLRRESRDRPDRPARDEVIRRVSTRYGEILREIGYPKLDLQGELGPFIDDGLVPHVRGRNYREASSGGQVLISLAWILAIFETAYEQQAAHPGFLMIDSPQKSLGGYAAADDTEFSDAALVERFYRHLLRWLSGAGAGAQVIIVDNTPPPIADPHVVVRFTRDPNVPRFGLIDDEIG